MKVETESISFVIPADFEDITNYSFKRETRHELLTVTYGRPGPGVTTVDEMLAQRRRHLEMAMGKECSLEGEKPVKVAGLQGRQLSFLFRDGRQQFRERWAVALLDASRYVQISYTTYEVDSGAEERFGHIIETAKLVGSPRPRPAPGYVRRHAGRIHLDVPLSLQPINTYSLRSTDGSINLTLTIHDFRQGEIVPVPQPKEAIESLTLDGSTIQYLPSAHLAVGRASGEMLQCVLTRESSSVVTRMALNQGILKFSENLIVTFGGTAEEAQAAKLSKALASLVNSLTSTE